MVVLIWISKMQNGFTTGRRSAHSCISIGDRLVNRRFTKRMWVLAAGLLLGLAGCQPAGTLAPAPVRAALVVSPSWTAAPAQDPALPSPTLEATRTPALTVTARATPAPVFYEPAGCWQ